jgi:hypothetical protein
MYMHYDFLFFINFVVPGEISRICDVAQRRLSKPGDRDAFMMQMQLARYDMATTVRWL